MSNNTVHSYCRQRYQTHGLQVVTLFTGVCIARPIHKESEHYIAKLLDITLHIISQSTHTILSDD